MSGGRTASIWNRIGVWHGAAARRIPRHRLQRQATRSGGHVLEEEMGRAVGNRWREKSYAHGVRGVSMSSSVVAVSWEARCHICRCSREGRVMVRIAWRSAEFEDVVGRIAAKRDIDGHET